MRSITVGLGPCTVCFVMFSDCLEMVIGRGDVTGCGKMMVLARRVALGVRHDVSFQVMKMVRNADYVLNERSLIAVGGKVGSVVHIDGDSAHEHAELAKLYAICIVYGFAVSQPALAIH